MTPPLDARERVQLCARLEEVGPDAPTLCEGWTTFDLAAHLDVRERNPVAAPGILLGERIPPLGRITGQAMARTKERGYAALLDRIRTGPPFGPFRIPALREQLNLNEYAVHHEDVRRANGMGPRDDLDDLQEALWKLLRRSARLLFRAVPKPYGLALARPGGDTAEARASRPTVTVTGEPLELVLFGFGRKGAAQVQFDGDPAAVAAVRDAALGI
ncbi:MAG: TIGR03085 family protein [Acidimicrobiia bacterium]|nr:TIGR03085 family protein [Acidimicrobiia bacterium]